MPIGNPVGYQYTWQPPSTVTDTYLDRAVNWIVGACTSANPASSCVLSAPQAIWFSAQDLVGENTGARPHPSSMTFRANASNAGTTRTPPFTANFSVYQVLLDNFNHCRTDANSPDVVNDPNVYAITINGFVAPFAALPRTATGLIDTTSIVGLHRAGLFTSWMPINVNPGLPASSPPTELLEWDVPTSTRPMGLATILALDTTGAVREQNESNNLNVECNVAQ
jgi:hypothetical protein